MANLIHLAMQRGLGGSPHERLHQDKENAPLRSWGGSAVLGRQRGLGEAAPSRGGSPRRRNLITLSLYGWSAMQMHE
ncbi:MAG: hypothetical protein F6K55_16480 [Moorea sp. SIO4A3]|nr:hypothetical protein [Moorena sp. SIO4A3]